ncbi:MAG: polysaccharide deacetylase family protein [Desulfonatronovibrionaceae bacterium]
MKNAALVIILFVLVVLFVLPAYCSEEQTDNHVLKQTNFNAGMQAGEKAADRHKNKSPEYWGEDVPGVVTGIETREKIAFLTLDACAGGFDRDIIGFLKKEKIPASLFVTSDWIDEHPEKFLGLVRDPLFSIANHGTRHRPLSTAGKKAFGIQGTKNTQEILKEVLGNYFKIKQITGHGPLYFRSGTAYYDEVAVDIIHELGMEVIGFSVAADEGGTLDREEIRKNVLKTKPGGIILAHINQPGSDIAKGLCAGIRALRKRGWEFKALKEYEEDFIRTQPD